ncbi:MAG: TonB-dependent receptor [Candidatus Binatia bacterium]
MTLTRCHVDACAPLVPSPPELRGFTPPPTRGEELDQKGVKNIVDLGAAVPNLRVGTNVGGSSGMTIGLRGVVQGNPNVSLQMSVGLYVDGAYISKMMGSNFDLEDLERVEVLRGPQGTLYGRNTIGGAVNFITNKPTEERSITLSTQAGNYDTFNGRATINVPLVGKNGFVQSDTLGIISLRETAGYKTHEGYYRNGLQEGQPTTRKPDGPSRLQNLNRVFTTTALRWQPTKDVTVDYSFEYHRYRDSQTPVQLTFVYPNSPVGGLFGPALDVRPYILKNRSDVIPVNNVYESLDFPRLHRASDDGNERMHILTAAWDLGELPGLGNVTLKSIASYRKFVSNQNLDLDGTPLQIANGSNRTDTENWSEELQWVGTAPRLHYVAGFYYYGENAQYDNPFVAFLGSVNLLNKNFSRLKSYAPYGQLTWTPPILSDKLSLTVGLRYTQEQAHVDKFFRDINHPANDFSASHGRAFGFHGSGVPGLSPMGDLSYQWTNDLMTYFRISRGFRGGGFAGDAGTPQTFAQGFQPERLLQYEAGFKSQWLDNRLRFNATGFYSDYNDLQVSVYRASVATGPASLLTNAATAEIWGMEFEGAAIPFPGLEATLDYGFLAPTYTKWLDQKFDAKGNPIFDSAGNPVLENVKDQRAFAYAPKNQLMSVSTKADGVAWDSDHV